MRVLCFFRAAAIVVILGLSAMAEIPYQGPKPAKADLPYLVHGNRIAETDQGEAQQSEDKKRTVYTVSGTAATARTPLSEPVFLMKPEKLKAEQLTLYKMSLEKGNRVIAFRAKPDKDDPQPVPMLYHNRKDGTVIFEANQYLENGEYCLSPSGANTVFCFQVY
jgi:hypothetical protein